MEGIFPWDIFWGWDTSFSFKGSGRKEGRKEEEGRKEGRQAGRQEGRKEGRKPGFLGLSLLILLL